MYKIIFIDIDGTLVDNKKQISEKTKQVLKQLVKNNIKIVLTSARPYKSIVDYANECNLDSIHIGSNGAIVANIQNDDILLKKEMQKERAVEIINKAIQNDIFIMATINGYQYIQFEKWGTSPKSRKDVVFAHDIKNIANDSNLNIIKLVLLDNDKAKLTSFRDSIKNIQDLTVMPIEIMTIPDEIRNKNGVCENPYNLDIMAQGISKAKGIDCVLKYYKLNKSESIGIGDGLNDLDLFEAVGLKIAMKNANEKLKQNADIITEYDNNNSGVADVLEKIFRN